MSFSVLTMGQVRITIFRDDLNHDTISGNKLHKLRPNIARAKKRKCSTILSFGGPYSNHLHALAWACKEQGLESIGVVRGELHANLTPTLEDCKKWGMQLISSQRKDYRRYQDILSAHRQPCIASEVAIPIIVKSPQTTLILPEGGSNSLAIESVRAGYRPIFTDEHAQGISHAVCATGTGATVAGLRMAAPRELEVIGMQAVAEGAATLDRVCGWLGEKPKNLTIEAAHLGGFGKMPVELLDFIKEFEAAYAIPLDPVYNGKALFQVSKMIKAGDFTRDHSILFIHTGGLQGNRRDDD